MYNISIDSSYGNYRQANDDEQMMPEHLAPQQPQIMHERQMHTQNDQQPQVPMMLHFVDGRQMSPEQNVQPAQVPMIQTLPFIPQVREMNPSQFESQAQMAPPLPPMVKKTTHFSKSFKKFKLFLKHIHQNQQISCPLTKLRDNS